MTDKLENNNFLWAGIQGLHHSHGDGLFWVALTVLLDAEYVYFLAFFLLGMCAGEGGKYVYNMS